MVKLDDPQPLGGVAKFGKLNHLRSCVKSMKYSQESICNCQDHGTCYSLMALTVLYFMDVLNFFCSRYGTPTPPGAPISLLATSQEFQ